MNGTDLLTEFRKNRSDAAFSELVQRYTNLVYSVAKRRIWDASLAEEVTQLVFVRLAKAAPNLPGDAELVAWLHRTTVHVAIDLWRSETRRRAREERSVSMQENSHSEAAWSDVSKVIDDELNQLNDADRQAILLRFFDHQPMREIGTALGISEDAAKMRVSRALDKLRDRLSARGVTCSAAVLAAMVLENSVEAAPSALVASLAMLKGSSLIGAAGTGMGLLHVSIAKLAAIVAALALLTVALVVTQKSMKASVAVAPTAQSQTSAQTPISASFTSDNTNTSAANVTDPIELLKKVIEARQRITSGVLEYQVGSSFMTGDVRDTNRFRISASFDGVKRRFDIVSREYGYAETETKTKEVIDSRIRELNGDREKAVEEGLLVGMNMHYVDIYDGFTTLEYMASDREQGKGTIIDPNEGSIHMCFDPRCLGLVYPSVRTTLETAIPITQAVSVQLLGQAFVDEAPAWQIRLDMTNGVKDFWLDMKEPSHVLKVSTMLETSGNGEVLTSRFTSRNDPLPTTVRLQRIRKGVVTSETRIDRFNSVFNTNLDPATWTLAGLGMPIGTAITDRRLHRMIGYWDGNGVSAEPVKQTDGLTNAQASLQEKLAVIETSPVTEDALRSAIWIMLNTPDGPNLDKAAEVIQTHHLFNPDLGDFCKDLLRAQPRSSVKLLQAILQNNPDQETRANACFVLGAISAGKAGYGKNRQATEDAIKYLGRVVNEFGSVLKIPGSMNFAKTELTCLQSTSIGKTAPEIEGEDLDGRRMRLSDSRGKTTVLIFWMQSESDQKEFAKLQPTDSVSIVGVYCGTKLADAQALAEKSGTSWPTFWDGDCRIQKSWTTTYPHVVVIDSKGIIHNRGLRFYSEITNAISALAKE